MNNAQIARGLNITPDAQRRVSLILDRIVTGSKETFYTPYVMEKDPDSILNGWDSIFNSNLSKLNDPLKVLELEVNRPKFGPMSHAKSWDERKESVYDSYKQMVNKITFTPYDLGPLLRLRPISVQSAIGYLKNDSNSGLPEVTKKRTVKMSFMGYNLDDLYRVVYD